jgi:hypothetical protein
VLIHVTHSGLVLRNDVLIVMHFLAHEHGDVHIGMHFLAHCHLASDSTIFTIFVLVYFSFAVRFCILL